ncbi:MAG: HD domain-containing protein [Promethearchaeia archaeon]
MIKPEFMEKIYDSAFIQRWNDHARPIDLYELDKQAHKTVIAFFLAKMEETLKYENIDWIYLIEGCIFEFLQRIVLTDIKPPVYYKMMIKKGKTINQWVFEQYKPLINNLDGNFLKRFKNYLTTFNDLNKKEKKIIQAAHYLATNWEFKLIYNLNHFIYGIDKTKEEIENQIEDHYNLIGIQRILLKKKSFGFIDLCGQLRFQKRWAQTPRIPQTSVLGHMFIVAILSYFCSIKLDACKKRRYNNFFGGLFHDLPEVLTRDIISPVKKSIEGLEEIIKEYEHLQIEQKLLPLLPISWHKEMKYFIEDEFTNKIIKNNDISKNISIEIINEKYNNDKYNPYDGKIIKLCDDLSAFLEAYLSIKYGIQSSHLRKGLENLYEKYKDYIIANINFGKIYRYFWEKLFENNY